MSIGDRMKKNGCGKSLSNGKILTFHNILRDIDAQFLVL